ncbi:MAG: hypothetical protein KKC46_08610 [Proteobacteria bacterium]|nr:hypothetical protein [Pseudomonadota bacterium]
MGKLIKFLDDAKACLARVALNRREYVFISIAQVGVLVKRSRFGIFGPKLYEETNISSCMKMSKTLDKNLLSHKSLSYLPKSMNDPVLKSFTRLAIESNSRVEFCAKIEKAKQLIPQGK